MMDKDEEVQCLVAADRLRDLGFEHAADQLTRLVNGPKVWLLTPRKGEWNPWYDTASGFVVVATTEAGARVLASYNHGDEGAAVWMDKKVTHCVEIAREGANRVVLRDYQRA